MRESFNYNKIRYAQNKAVIYQRKHRNINLIKHANALYFWNGQTTCFMQYLAHWVGLSILTSSLVCFAKEKPFSLMFKTLGVLRFRV